MQARPIVCATRGGQASRRAQERAIALARERGAELIFVCVAESVAEVQDEALAAALSDELCRLARSLLCVAQSRAQKQHLEAEAVVLQGEEVWQCIERFLRQVNAGALVIGAPQSDSGEQSVESAAVYRFAEVLRQSMDIEVIMVE